jgi:DUF4097 and DUF4098 domain-containing protein YvlB
MDRLSYKASEGMTIRLIQVDSDTVIQAGAGDIVELVLDGETDQCTAVPNGDDLEISSHVPLSISVPAAAAVHVTEVGGDLILRGMDGTVTVEMARGECLLQSGQGTVSLKELFGDLTAEGTSCTLTAGNVHSDVRLGHVDGSVTLGSVHGDVRARSVNGALQMGTIDGNVRLREIQGEVVLEEGNSDFKGTDLQGGMNVQLVKGMLTLKSALTPGMTYRGHANGDIVVRCPEGTSAQYTLKAKGELRAALQEMKEMPDGGVVGRTGDGEAQVELSAGGELSLKIRGQRERFEMPFDFGPDIAAEIEAQIAETMGSLDLDALAQREIEKAMRKAEREIEKARRRSERGRREAQDRMRRAQERAARSARRAHERFSRRGHLGNGSVFGGSYTFKFERGRSAKPKVSEDEQLSILKMVQEGKITIEEAEELLKALGG